MKKRPWIVLVIVLLAGCESNVQKLGRLRREKEAAYGRMIAAQDGGNVDSIRVTEQRLAVIEGQLNEFFKKK